MVRLIGVIMALSLVFVGCTKESGDVPVTETEEVVVESIGESTGGDVSATEPQAAAVESAGGDIGVPECDEYLKKLADCVDKMPDQVKDTYRNSLEQSRIAWKQAAADSDASKESLKAGCQAALDGLAQLDYCK